MAKNILVSGTMAFDTLETPFGKKEKILGGSANYFSLAASLFTRVELSAIVGGDFPGEYLEYLNQKGIGTANIEISGAGLTFHWEGKYSDDMNSRDTIATHLNVLLDYNPSFNRDAKKCGVLFLANIDPEIQLKVIDSAEAAELVITDTMDFWISGKREALDRVIAKTDVLIINEHEARQLTGKSNIFTAVEEIVKYGPKVIIIKRGEYGAFMYHKKKNLFYIPAYPVKEVFDPTGAGDTFAGGFTGYLATCREPLDLKEIKKAMLYGTVMASFTVNDFGVEALKKTSRKDADKRFEHLMSMIEI
ncbi:MAG: sugar kinase [Oligoflexia bacterium]|nr:sugar kinase [Oligoflexia bacterium]